MNGPVALTTGSAGLEGFLAKRQARFGQKVIRAGASTDCALISRFVCGDRATIGFADQDMAALADGRPAIACDLRSAVNASTQELEGRICHLRGRGITTTVISGEHIE